MDFEDFETKTTRKVRIGAIFARKVALGAIFGPVLEGWGWERPRKTCSETTTCAVKRRKTCSGKIEVCSEAKKTCSGQIKVCSEATKNVQ